MTVDIPTPFDLLTSTAWNKGNIGTPVSVGTKANGGIQLDEMGVQWTADDTSPSSTDEGIYNCFNAPPSETPVDMTNEIFVISRTFNAQNRIQIRTRANHGISFWLYTTSTSNYKKWIIGGNDTARPQLFSNSHRCIVVDPASTAQETGGSGLTITSVLWYGCAVRREDIASSNTSWSYISRAVRMDTTKSGADTPRLYGSGVKLKDLYSEVHQTDWTDVNHNYVEKMGNAYFYACPFVIGKSASTTTFDDEGITVMSPSSNDTADPRFHLTTNSMRVYLDLQTSDTATFSGTYVWGTRAPFDFNTSETVTLSGATFKGMGALTMGAGVTGDATFNDTGLVTLNASADLDGSTFKNPYGNHLLSIG